MYMYEYVHVYEYHMMYIYIIWQYDYTGRSLPSDTVYYRPGYYTYTS